MSRKAVGRFKSFLDQHESTSGRLPLIHITTAYSFYDLHDEDSIEPAHCKYFDTELIYLFYGRPAYKTENSEFTDLEFNLPIVFVFDPDKISVLKAVYPFDTGAFFLHLYKRFFHEESKIEDFALPGSLDYAEKLVGTFYTDSEEYLRGRSTKNIEIPVNHFEAQGVQRLAREPSYTARLSEDRVTRDERSSSIEVQLEEPLSIRDAAKAIIVPSHHLKLDYMRSALINWGMGKESIYYYEIFDLGEAATFSSQIYAKVLEIYRKLGYIQDLAQ